MARDSAHEKAIGARLRRVRGMFALSQAKFALSLGIGRPKLAAIEEGRARLRFGVYLEAWRNWGLNARWLASGDGLPIGPSSEGFATAGISPEALFSRAFAEYCAANPAPPSEHAPLNEGRFQSALLRMMREIQTLANADESARDRLLETPGVREALAALANHVSSAIGAHLMVGTEGFCLTNYTNFGPSVPVVGRIENQAVRNKMLQTENRAQGKDFEEIGLTSPLNEDSLAPMPTTIPDWQTLREMIAQITQKQGSRKKLMEDFRVSKQTASAWLNGTREPDADTTIALIRWCEKGGKK
jgi:transcriptional regulator with XRE-family HTH domain